MNKNRKKNRETESTAEAKLKGFLDMIAPSVIQFYTDHYICGNTYRSVWALREYPTATDEQAILRHLGEKDGVTLRIYTRQVTPAEEKKIISNAANKNRMKQGNTENLQETVTAASNLQDVTAIISTMHRNREPLLHTAVFLELSAPDMEKLKLLQTEVLTELIRSKLNVDKLLLRQKQGFLCVHPAGRNVFREQFERALPASSVANLFPFNYSGKTDKNGFYIGRDKFGSNVIVDFNQRADDKTNANILILGNSGQGKSYLLKLILTILRESGMKVICLDPEHEYIDLTNNLGGCFVDLMSGEYIINVLEWKVMYDSSIVAVKKGGGSAGDEYKVEFVSPICEYADIPTIQELVRQLRHAGAIAGENAGIHVHVNAAPYTARTLRNITNIMYCKEDLIYKALQVDVEREHRYCKKVEESFLQELNQKKPKSIDEVSNIWYQGRDGRNRHYHESRYHCLNLHSVFQKGTIEFRLFNSTTHAGKIKTYIQLCLAISAQALNQSSASRIKTTSTNEKYTFRTWLLRLGMIGDEFKTARKFLLENLEGGIAWKDPEQAERQKERLRAKKEKEEANQTAEAENLQLEEGAEEESQGMHMTM